MERHENVVQGVTDKRERQAARSSTNESLRQGSRHSEHNRDGQLNDPRDQKTEERTHSG